MVEKYTNPLSPHFLHQLRQDISTRTKTSKAVLQAMKSLSNQNDQQKRIIEALDDEIQNLKQQNCLLVELVEKTKQQFTEQLKLKEKKLQDAYELEAKLTGENQSLKKQIDLFLMQKSTHDVPRDQVETFQRDDILKIDQRIDFKIQQKEVLEIELEKRQELRENQLRNVLKEKEIEDGSSEMDLAAYLQSQTSGKEQNFIQEQLSCELNLAIQKQDRKILTGEKSKEKSIMYKSSFIQSARDSQEETYRNIINPNHQESSLLSQ